MHKVVVVVNCIVIFDKKIAWGDALLYERIIFIIKAYDENLKAENKSSVWSAPWNRDISAWNGYWLLRTLD
jgi:hypothetical protein